MVRRLPYNWKRVDGDGFNRNCGERTRKMKRRTCYRGEGRVSWLAPRGIASLGNRRGVMMTIAYLTFFLPSPHLRRRCCLPVFGEEQRERESKDARERERERERESEGEVVTAFVVIVVIDA